jgi:hypothetical protein
MEARQPSPRMEARQPSPTDSACPAPHHQNALSGVGQWDLAAMKAGDPLAAWAATDPAAASSFYWLSHTFTHQNREGERSLRVWSFREFGGFEGG